jgi:hypothetical protein
MIGALSTAPGGFNKVLVSIDKFTKWIEFKPVTCPKADRLLYFLDELVHRYGLPRRIITDLAPTSTITSSGSTARTAGSTYDMCQLPILRPMDKSSMPTGRYLMLSRSDCTMLLTQKEASGSRNYPMRSRAVYSTLQPNGTIPILPGLRLRRNSPCRRHVRFASSRAIRKGHI